MPDGPQLFEKTDPDTAALFEEASDAISVSISKIEETSKPNYRESYSKPDRSGMPADGTRSIF